MAGTQVLHIGAHQATAVDGGAVLVVNPTDAGPVGPGPGRALGQPTLGAAAGALGGARTLPRGPPPASAVVFEVLPPPRATGAMRLADDLGALGASIVVRDEGGGTGRGAGGDAVAAAGANPGENAAAGAGATLATSIASPADRPRPPGVSDVAVPFEQWCPRAMAHLAMALYDPERAPAACVTWGAVRSAAPALAAHARRSELALLETEAAILQMARDGPNPELERALGEAKLRYHHRCERTAAALTRWSAVTRELCSASALLGAHAQCVKTHLDDERVWLCRCATSATAGGSKAASESLHWRDALLSIVTLEYESSLRASRAACDTQWQSVPRRPPRHPEAEAAQAHAPPVATPRSVQVARYAVRSEVSFEATALAAALAIYTAVEAAVGARPPWHIGP